MIVPCRVFRMMLVLLLRLYLVAGQAEEEQRFHYPLPDFIITTLMLQAEISPEEYLNELVTVTTSHIEATLRDQMPETGPLSLSSFRSILLIPVLGDAEVRNSNATQPQLVVSTNFTGSAVFVTQEGAPPEGSSFMKRAMVNLVRLSLGSEVEYTTLVARYQATTTLGNLKTVKIWVETPPGLDETDDYQPPSELGTQAPAAGPDPPPTKKSKGILFIMIIVLAAVLMAFLAFKISARCWRMKKDAKSKGRWSKASREASKASRQRSSRRLELKRDQSSGRFSTSNNGSFSNNSDSEEQWMDNMAEKMTSIKLSKSKGAGKPQQRPSLIPPQSQPRLGSTRKNNLHCIMEESDESCSDASALSEDQGQFDLESENLYSAPTLGRYEDGSEGLQSSSDDLGYEGVFLQEGYGSRFDDPRTRSSTLAL
jgi:hypothetical protein